MCKMLLLLCFCLTRTLTYPFDFYTWLMLILSIPFVALSLFILNQETNVGIHGGYKAKGFHIFSIIVTTLFGQTVPRSWTDFRKYNLQVNVWKKINIYKNKVCMLATCRNMSIFLVTWFMYGLLITFAYRSTLLASLVSVEKEKPVDTFQSLLDNEMTLFMARGTLTTAIMRDSPSKTLRYLL